MNAEIDVFISNYTLIDSDIFQQWIEGYSSSEASFYLKQKCFGQFMGAHVDLIVSDILDQYRTYSLLERLLHSPIKLPEQSSFQLDPQTRTFIIEKYYSVDDSVAREILGKKLSSRYRKDLDEVSEKTFVKLKSCSSEMNAEIDVFISNYTLIDSDIFQQWIEGYSSSEASFYLKQKCFGQFMGAHVDLIVSDILDQYRTYSLLERLLHSPIKLPEQSSFQLDPQTRTFIIEKYYSVDDSVAREILGKKLSSRYRKDLDEVSEKTFVKLKSCRRQFDNVKRIFKAVEEMPGNLTNNIKQHFMLSDELAKKYASIVFLACLRFETSKKKLNYLSFSDLFYCSQSIMEYWTYTYQHSGPEYYDTEMDKEFLLDLREIRCLLDKEKEIKHLVCLRLKPILLEKMYQELDSNFRSYWRSIITIACNLHRNRELRGLFVDLCEKLIDPWKQSNWNREQVKQFLSAVAQGILDLEISRDHETRCLWDRYMQVISICLEKMYHV